MRISPKLPLYLALSSSTASAFVVLAPSTPRSTQLNQSANDWWEMPSQRGGGRREPASFDRRSEDIGIRSSEMQEEGRMVPMDGDTRRDPYENPMMSPHDEFNSRTIQGGSLFTQQHMDNQAIDLRTDGRPLDTQVEWWEGPNHTPTQMQVYSQDGRKHGIRTVVGERRNGGGYANPSINPGTASIRNTGPMEFPVQVSSQPFDAPTGPGSPAPASAQHIPRQTIQGGALKTWSIDYDVGNVVLTIESSGMPISARIELLEGPNNVKAAADLDNEDGYNRPCRVTLDCTRGVSKTLQIRNLGPLEFPLYASMDVY